MWTTHERTHCLVGLGLRVFLRHSHISTYSYSTTYVHLKVSWFNNLALFTLELNRHLPDRPRTCCTPSRLPSWCHGRIHHGALYDLRCYGSFALCTVHCFRLFWFRSLPIFERKRTTSFYFFFSASSCQVKSRWRYIDAVFSESTCGSSNGNPHFNAVSCCRPAISCCRAIISIRLGFWTSWLAHTREWSIGESRIGKCNESSPVRHGRTRCVLSWVSNKHAVV
jgi:hypothetical protein